MLFCLFFVTFFSFFFHAHLNNVLGNNAKGKIFCVKRNWRHLIKQTVHNHQTNNPKEMKYKNTFNYMMIILKDYSDQYHDTDSGCVDTVDIELYKMSVT